MMTDLAKYRPGTARRFRYLLGGVGAGMIDLGVGCFVAGKKIADSTGGHENSL
jgi:hypothetical protein